MSRWSFDDVDDSLEMKYEARPFRFRAYAISASTVGLADIALHHIRCDVTQEMRVQMRWMTWRAMSARPWSTGQVTHAAGVGPFNMAAKVPDIAKL